jgi:hypothetical protein
VDPQALVLRTVNVSSLEVDLRRAGLSCNAELLLQAEGAVTVDLVGCGRSVELEPSLASTALADAPGPVDGSD